MKNHFFTILLLLLSYFTVAQSDIKRLNDYKYFIVPVQFKTADEPNEYLLSSLAKHLLEQENIPVIIDSDLYPEDLSLYPCLGVRVELIDENTSFSFSTDVALKFIDCNNFTVFTTSVGKSKIKSYREAYQEALRNAFHSTFVGFTYAYNEQAQKQEKTSDVEKVQPKSQNRLDNFTSRDLLRGEDVYLLQTIEAGYLVSAKESGERIALITRTSSGDYLYNSDQITGSLQVKENQFEVEYFDKVEASMKKLIYTLAK